MQILNMVEEGKITAEEGVRLLDALENNRKTEYHSKAPKAKWFKIKVIDPKNGEKVNVKLPISLIGVGTKLASKFSPEFNKTGLNDADMEEILRIAQSGEIGKILEVNTDDGAKVEIVIE